MSDRPGSRLDRRQFLELAGLGTAAVATAGALSSCVAPPTWPQIAALGHLYIARVPAEGDHATLSALLGDPPADSTPPTLIQLLQTQISAEHTTDTTRMITGLLLSVTEWRIAAYWATR